MSGLATFAAWRQIRKAQECLERGASRRAASIYVEFLQAHPGDPGAWLWAGAALAEAGAFAQAREYVEKGMALRPNSATGRLFLARVLFDADQVAEARQVLESCGGNEHAKALLAACLLRLAETEAAREIAGPRLPHAPWALGRLLLAIEEVAKAPQENPAPIGQILDPNGRPVWFASRQIRRGLVCLRAEKWEAALRAFSKAYRVRPKDARAGYGLGIALYYLYQYEESERRLMEVIDLLEEPFFSDALATLGKLDVEFRRYSSAVLRLRRAIAAGAATPENYYALGLAYVRSRKPRHARKAFQRCAFSEFVRERIRDLVNQ